MLDEFRLGADDLGNELDGAAGVAGQVSVDGLLADASLQGTVDVGGRRHDRRSIFEADEFKPLPVKNGSGGVGRAEIDPNAECSPGIAHPPAATLVTSKQVTPVPPRPQ